MSTEAKIKVVENDPNSLYKTLEVRFSSDKKITTPMKAVDLARLKNKYPINSSGRGLNEIFKRFTPEDIKKYDEDNISYNRLESDINALKSRIGPGESTICFLEFRAERMPNSEELEFMTTTAYPHSQITSIPFVSYFNKIKQTEELFNEFKTYVSGAIENINQLNNKPIMGIIPRIAPKKMVQLSEFYHSQGINCFAMDLDGSNPISQSGRIFRFLKALKKNDLLDESYIHGYNVGFRATKNTDYVPAKNILGYGVGLDSLGENKFRLFNKEDYSYWKGLTLPQVEQIYPKDSLIDLDMFNTYADKNFLQKLFNTEQLSIESARIRAKINEDPERALTYLKGKKDVCLEDLSVITDARKKIEK
jgi:hypothetical protein